MRQVRRGIFETNSSSTHSITICSKEEYGRWERGEVFKHGRSFYTFEEVIEKLKADKYFNKYNPNFDFSDKDEVRDILREEDFLTSEEYFEDESLETFKSTYTTKSGDEVVAFGKYGYDG